MKENNFYVYLHIKEDNGEPFYVGKGGKRSDKTKGKFRYDTKHHRSIFWHNIVNKHGFDIIFLEIDLSEEEAFEKEIYWINRIGRRDLNNGPLVNHTDGGEGVSGRKHSDIDKKKISEGVLKYYENGGVHHFLGKKLTKEHKDKISLNGKGTTVSDEGKINIGMGHRKHIKVIQYNTNMEILKIWDSHHNFIDQFDEGKRSGKNTLLSVCKEKKGTYKGYIWRFFNE